MPTTKGKGGSMSHRHRPASEYDKATLAQKREYWRTKKREQRARLSERRRNQTQDSRGKKLLHPNSPAVVNSKFSGSFAALSSPLQSNDESYKPANICPASRSGNTEGESSVEANGSQKERWLEKTNLNKVLPQLPASSYSISAKAAGGDTVRVKCLTRGAVSKALSSLAPGGTQLNTSSLVPPVSVTRIIKGRFTNITPQPMQGALVPKPQLTAQVAVCSQPKLLPTNVTTGMILVSPASIKTEGKAANTTAQSGTKSALVISQRAKGVNSSPPSLMSEEERAAKRREQWRIKKREQRAKLAAQRAKARERLLGTEMTSQRQTARKTRTMGDAILHHLPSQSFLRGVDQKQCPPPVKTSFTSVKREYDEPQSVTGLAPVNLQADQIKVKNPHPAIKSDVTPVKKAVESQRKLQNHSHLSNVSKGMARCKTPRQRFNEAHKNFMNQRNMRCKSPLLVSIFGSRNIPKIDPNDTPEQIIAKRREYWRIKKREQRAKLSMEMKTRLKEKDSLMRRVKRYQKILEEMRRARTLTHASDTIGGFIKEDGTVTINISEVPTGQKSEEELHVVSNNNHIRNPQHQPDTKQSSPVGAKQLPPPLRLPQVKVSLPRLGHSVNKPPTLLSDRPRTRLESTTVPHSHSPVIRTFGQLTLTHLQTTPNVVPEGSAAVSNPRGCVVKMAVSNSAPSTVPRDPASREEDRMAKKREYWRIKKREQRAARAVRLKQGVLQARANATLQRRKAQKQVAVTSVPTNHTQNAQTLPNNNSVAVMARASEIKQESEFMPAADLNSQPEQAICPDIKPGTSPPPPPVPQPESDPALSADSQATTLLAVASMKKLLEESLSTVTEYKSEQDNIQIKSEEDVSETGMRPDGTQIVLGKDKVLPVATDQMLEIKSWQPDTDALVQAGSTSFHLKDKPQISEIHPPLPTSSEVVLLPTCEHSSQTPSNLIINLMEPSDGPSSPCRTQRLYAKRVVGHQNCCSPEPPKLHHLPMDQLQQQHCEQPHLNNSALSAKKFSSVVMEHSGLTSLQRKREYWKLMKRQQRARLKARQTERRDDGSSWLKKKSIQAPGLIQTNTVKDVNHPEKPALKPKPSIGSLTAVTSIPTILVVSPTTCNAEQSRDTLQVKLPVTSVYCSSRSEQNKMNVGFTQSESDYLGAPENQQQEMPEQQKWMSRSSDVDSAPCLPTLKPPDNPLSSIDLQPIEPPGQTSNSPLRTIKMPCSQFQSPPHRVEPSTKLAPISTMVPPKPTPGESEEEFLRRKREYWRIKKKEQRARKAIRDKGVTSRRASNNWRPILPAQEIQTHDSSQWMSSSEEPGHLTITSLDNDVGSFPYSYTAPIEDESELLDADYENSNGDEGPVSDTVWRSRYLMDYDPLNQLLVCMVCGELQYSHSLEGVRAHIDEAHPDTLTMHLREKQRILEAWDEQVSQRERFFTSQLQQHSGALADTHRDRVN